MYEELKNRVRDAVQYDGMTARLANDFLDIIFKLEQSQKVREHIDSVLPDEYEQEVEKYLAEGINYGANTIKNADPLDLEQLAADSFAEGWNKCKERFGI